MPKFTAEELDKKVLNYVRAEKNTNTNRVRQHFKIKWETAERSLKRLQSEAKIFYDPKVKIWSISGNIKIQRTKSDSQQLRKREFSDFSTNSTFVNSLFSCPIVRGRVDERVEKEGFVCHPLITGEDVPSTFVRQHLKGQYLVQILKTGKMPTTFADSDVGFRGGWYEKPMKGNYGYFGHIYLPDDPKPFNFHSLGTKENGLTNLSVYIHPRYIYYKGCNSTASIEFRMQVATILKVLELYGWEFGSVEMRGTMHMALNNPVLPSLIPINHVERSTDPIHFDSSVKKGDGYCTEAEIYDDHPGSEEDVAFWVELPQRFVALEGKVADLRSDFNVLSDRVDILGNGLLTLTDYVKTLAEGLEKDAAETSKIAVAVDKLTQITELNTSVILGNVPVPDKEPIGYIAKPTKEDVMYG